MVHTRHSVCQPNAIYFSGELKYFIVLVVAEGCCAGGPAESRRTAMPRRSAVLNNVGETSMAEEELLTVREVARRLRVDDTTVRRWIKSGALEAVTLPHRGKRQAYRVKTSTMNKLLHSPQLPE
jgi:excisionase family DNA binding protein